MEVVDFNIIFNFAERIRSKPFINSKHFSDPSALSEEKSTGEPLLKLPVVLHPAKSIENDPEFVFLSKL